jgi:hypothetical protein
MTGVPVNTFVPVNNERKKKIQRAPQTNTVTYMYNLDKQEIRNL